MNHAEMNHAEMNRELFLRWFTTRLLPALDQPSVPVLDNAPYHSMLTEESRCRCPASAARKADLSLRIIKMTTAYIAEPLSKNFNQSVQDGRYPAQWKLATVKPVYKGKGSPSKPASHRPISLLPCLKDIRETRVRADIFLHQ